MNSINILGTMTRDIELRYTQSGAAIASFGIAYNEKRKQADGSYTDVSHFFDVTAFGKRAESLNQYFRKGSRILIDGSLDYQSWSDADGLKRSKVSIKLENFYFIDKRSDLQPQQQMHQSYAVPDVDENGYGYGGRRYAAPQPQYEQQKQPPPVYYENAQGRQVPPPQRQMPQMPNNMEIDDEEIPF